MLIYILIHHMSIFNLHCQPVERIKDIETKCKSYLEEQDSHYATSQKVSEPDRR